MKARDLATLCGVLMRLAGVALLVWGHSKEAWGVGLALLTTGEVGNAARAVPALNRPSKAKRKP